MSEINIEVAGRVMVPDIGIFTKMVADMSNDSIVASQLPLTTIEILSPSQSIGDLISEATAYFVVGVKSCWTIVPEVKGIFLYTAPGEYGFFHAAQSLVDAATGIGHSPHCLNSDKKAGLKAGFFYGFTGTVALAKVWSKRYCDKGLPLGPIFSIFESFKESLIGSSCVASARSRGRGYFLMDLVSELIVWVVGPVIFPKRVAKHE